MQVRQCYGECRTPWTNGLKPRQVRPPQRRVASATVPEKSMSTARSQAGLHIQRQLRSPSPPPETDAEYLCEDEEGMPSSQSGDHRCSYPHNMAEFSSIHKGPFQSQFLSPQPPMLGFTMGGQSAEWKEAQRRMMTKEQAMMKPKVFSNEYLARRPVMVEWMSQTSERVLNLSPLTLHTAVAYLDAVIAKLADQYVAPHRLQLVATACICAAGAYSCLTIIWRDQETLCQNELTRSVLVCVFLGVQPRWRQVMCRPRWLTSTAAAKTTIPHGSS